MRAGVVRGRRAPGLFLQRRLPRPDQRCAAPANADPTIPITCCLPGPRGAGKAGDPCTGLNDCQTAVCAYTPAGPLCSQPCDAGCPPTLPVCVTVDTADAGVSDGGIAQFCGLPP